MPPLLQVNHLVKTFTSWPLLPLRWLTLAGKNQTGTLALRDVSISADQGEVVGLIGPNGAGKTTLLKIIAGLILPTAGEVLIHDATTNTPARSDVFPCSLVSGDERSFYWRLTGRENLQFFATFANLMPREATKRIDSLLASMEIIEPDRLVGEYSSGMKQRLAVARGLLRNPPLLLLDEPTRSLDPGARDKFLAWVAGHLVKREGKTILWATHDLAEAEAICRRIYILADGRIREEGSPAELKRKAGLAESATLLDAYRVLQEQRE